MLDQIYSGTRAPLRPIHDALTAAIGKFGAFETEEGLRQPARQKAFAMIGPATNTQVEIGLSMKGAKGTARLVEQKAGGMCQYEVRVAAQAEIDAQLIDWIRTAYDAAQ